MARSDVRMRDVDVRRCGAAALRRAAQLRTYGHSGTKLEPLVSIEGWVHEL